MSRWMIIGLVGMFMFSIASAEVYTWKDEQGQVHYGDRPSAGEVEEVDMGSTAPPDEAPVSEELQDQQRYLKSLEDERRQRDELEAKQKEERAARRQRCAMARDQLATYERASGLYDLGKDGERRYLSNEERRKAEQNARKDVARWCK